MNDPAISDQQDILSSEPVLAKTIYSDEYFLTDQSILFSFKILMDNNGSLDGIFNRYMREIERIKGKSITEKKQQKIYNNFLIKLKELQDVGLIKGLVEDIKGNIVALQNFQFDRIFYEIVKVLHQSPSRIRSIQDQISVLGKDINDEQFNNYIKILEEADYIRLTTELYKDRQLNRLIQVLSKRPLTIKEIEIKYNKELNEKAKKSEYTIYRYIQTLKSANLVMNAGQRVTLGKTATEMLFSNTAKMYFTPEHSSEILKGAFGNKIGGIIKMILDEANNEFKPSKDCIQSILYKLTKMIEIEKEVIISKLPKAILPKFDDLSMHEINISFHHAALLNIIKNKQNEFTDLFGCLNS